MTDERARRLREMRNRATSGGGGGGEETDETADSDENGDAESAPESEPESESESASASGASAESESEPESESESASESESEPEPESEPESDPDDPETPDRDSTEDDTDEETPPETGDDDATAALDPSQPEHEGDEAPGDADGPAETGAEQGTAGDLETSDDGGDGDDVGDTDDADGITVSYDETETTAGSTIDALGGAIASRSAVAGVDFDSDSDSGAEPTVDASAMLEDADGYGDTAARKEAMFEQGTTLIHSAQDDESTVQMLEFYLNENRYAIEIDRVSAIVEMKDVTRFPRGPDAIDGVTDLRGEITGVLDPTAMLDVERNDLSDDQYIVVLERDDDKQKLGVRVTDVSQAVTYRDSQIDETGSVMDAAGEHQHECVRGIIKKQGADDRTILVAWLDIDELIANID